MPMNEMVLCAYVKRVNDAAMLGKEKAVSGEVQVPLTRIQNHMQGANGKKVYLVNIMDVALPPKQTIHKFIT